MKTLWRTGAVAVAAIVFILAPRACLASNADSAGAQAAAFQRITRSFLAGSKPHAPSCEASELSSFADINSSFRAIPLGLAIADFTGDSHPDLAAVGFDRVDASNGYYVIDIALSEGGSQSLSFAAPPGGLLLTPKDVTGDGTLDLVVRSAVSRLPVAVFFNNGCGHFYRRDSAAAARAIAAQFPSSDLAARPDVLPSAVATLANRVPTQGPRTWRPALRAERAFLPAPSEGLPASLAILNSGRAPPLSHS